MNGNPAGAALEAQVLFERQDFPAIGAGSIDRRFQRAKAALRELAAALARGNRDLDADPEGVAILAVMRQQHSIAQVAVTAEPEAIVEAFDRVRLPNLQVAILQRRDQAGAVVVLEERGDRHGFIAMLLVDAEKAQDAVGIKPVDRNL